MSEVLTIATRGGALALAQTRIVVAALKAGHPALECRVQVVTTSGDKDRRTILWDLDERGFFTSQLEQAVLEGKADAAVHSLKDLPTSQAEGLAIAAVCDRQFPEDCLVACGGIRSLAALPQGAKVGTSSLRRAAQLRHLRPDVEIVPLRGNVGTRLDRVDEGRIDAVVLARAGLERLGMADRMAFVFDPRQFIPAAAQGALAVQVRLADAGTRARIAAIDDPTARLLVETERQVLIETGFGCHAPIGAFAEMVEGLIRLHAFVADRQGNRLIRRCVQGPVPQWRDMAAQVGVQLLAGATGRQNPKGGQDILQSRAGPLDDGTSG